MKLFWSDLCKPQKSLCFSQAIAKPSHKLLKTRKQEEPLQSLQEVEQMQSQSQILIARMSGNIQALNQFGFPLGKCPKDGREWRGWIAHSPQSTSLSFIRKIIQYFILWMPANAQTHPIHIAKCCAGMCRHEEWVQVKYAWNIEILKYCSQRALLALQAPGQLLVEVLCWAGHGATPGNPQCPMPSIGKQSGAQRLLVFAWTALRRDGI